MKRSRVVLGTVLAPSVLPVTYMVVSLLFSGYPFGAPGHLEKFFLGVSAIAVVSYAASYLLGVPLVACLLAARRLTFLRCVALAVVMGAAATVSFYAYQESDPEYGFFALLGGAAALMVSSVFCVIVGAPFRKMQRTGPASETHDCIVLGGPGSASDPKWTCRGHNSHLK